MGMLPDGRPQPHPEWRALRAQLPLKLAATLRGVPQLPEVGPARFLSAEKGRAPFVRCMGVQPVQQRSS